MALSVVTPIRSEPPLTDIAARLRHLADRIEAGDVAPDAAHVVLTFADSLDPACYGFGNIESRHTIAGLFFHCAQLVLTDADEDTP